MHVLVVDDEPDLRLILQINLERWGHQVSVAAGAEEALGMCQESLPDAMLLDYSMPNRDAAWLLDELGADGWPQEVVILSAALPSQVAPLTERGARYLAKPFGVDALKALIDDVASSVD